LRGNDKHCRLRGNDESAAHAGTTIAAAGIDACVDGRDATLQRLSRVVEVQRPASRGQAIFEMISSAETVVFGGVKHFIEQ
jgi:hypothetical protein